MSGALLASQLKTGDTVWIGEKCLVVRSTERRQDRVLIRFFDGEEVELAADAVVPLAGDPYVP